MWELSILWYTQRRGSFFQFVPGSCSKIRYWYRLSYSWEKGHFMSPVKVQHNFWFKLCAYDTETLSNKLSLFLCKEREKEILLSAAHSSCGGWHTKHTWLKCQCSCENNSLKKENKQTPIVMKSCQALLVQPFQTLCLFVSFS